jgi:hypothetical protein
MSKNRLSVRFQTFDKSEIDEERLVAEIRELATQQGLSDNDVIIDPGQLFPVEGAILILITLASNIVLEIVKNKILEKTKQKYIVIIIKEE